MTSVVPTRAIPVFTPQQMYIGALRSHLHVREEPRNSNRGQSIEAYLAACGIEDPNPWCLAFLSYVGWRAFGAQWGVPRYALCQDLANWARRTGVRMLPSEAAIGDMFLVWYPKEKRFRHVGVITGPKDDQGRWATIEGNTNDGGSRDGWGVFPRFRALAEGDRIVQWWKVWR